MEKRKPRILIIEDDEYSREAIEHLLNAEGCETKSAANGVSGYRAARRFAPNIIVLDLNLPDIDGVEVTARLKCSPELAHIPVVALTANAMHGDRERFLAAGCDGYIPKPITKNELLTTIANLLANKNGR